MTTLRLGPGGYRHRAVTGGLMPLMAWLLPIFLLTLSACGSSAFRQLPDSDKDVFYRCNNMLVAAQCGEPDSTFGNNVCISMMQDRYAKAPDQADWLIANGCPPSMVDPGGVMAEDRQVAAAPAAPSPAPTSSPRAIPYQVPVGSPFDVVSARALDRPGFCEVVVDYRFRSAVEGLYVISAVAVDQSGAALAMSERIAVDRDHVAQAGDARAVTYGYADLPCSGFYGIRLQP